ncbi:MAG: hypothetical protein PHT19_17435 [Methylococcus sp.]|nr:hypothetical protein [Methylococcus sp.]
MTRSIAERYSNRAVFDTEYEEIIEIEPFAQGQTRAVFYLKEELDSQRTVVVKKILGNPGCVGPNWMEWFIWGIIQSDNNLRSKFGQCLNISITGNYLMMEYLGNLNGGEIIPSRPSWVNDNKGIESYGRSLEGQIKIRDYGMVRLEGILQPEDNSWINI